VNFNIFKFTRAANLNILGPSTSIASFFNWGLSFIVTKTFVTMQEGLTIAGAYWLFGAFCFLGVIFTAFALPETKGKTYDEIQALFGNNEKRTEPESQKQ
jgi:Sugar (and other) transporter